MAAVKAKLIPVMVEVDGCTPSVVDTPLSESDAVEFARLLGALAGPVRLRLMSLVASRQEICSCDLEVPRARSQPTISPHQGPCRRRAYRGRETGAVDVVAGRAGATRRGAPGAGRADSSISAPLRSDRGRRQPIGRVNPH